MNRLTVLVILFCLIASTAEASKYSVTDYGVTSSEIYLSSTGQVGFSPNNSFVPDSGPWNFGHLNADPYTLQIFNTQTGKSSEISSNSLRGNTPTGPISGEISGLFSNSSGNIIVGGVEVSDNPGRWQAWVENLNSFNAGPHLIPIPSGFNELQPVDINSSGSIVGSAVLPNGSTRAFLYNGTTTVDLNTLIPPDSGFTLTSAVQIGDLGQIVGYAVDASGHTHDVLLTPTTAPEPSSLLIALCSMVAFPFVIRRRKLIGVRRSTTAA